MASSKAKESAVQKWIDSATGLPNFSRHTTANLETRTIAGAELYYEGFYGSIVAAAKALGVPYKRLYYRVNGHHSTAENGGNRHHIQGRALQQHANAILKAKGVGATASRAWAKRFIQRHRELFHRRRAAARDIKRKAMQDRIHVEAFFRGWSQTIEKDEILPKNTWNFDETGFMVGYLHKGTFIWTFREIDTPILSDAHDTVSVTAIEAISAAGSCIPSFVILPGVQIPARWVTNSLDDDTIISTSQKGYINDVIAIEWIKHFEKHTRPVDPLQKRLLLWIAVIITIQKRWFTSASITTLRSSQCLPILHISFNLLMSAFLGHTNTGINKFYILQDTLSSLTEEVAIKDLPGSIESEPQGGPQAARPSTPSPHTPPRFNDSTGTMFQRRDSTSLRFRGITPTYSFKARKADKTLALNGITATAEMTKIKEKQAKRSSLQQQTTIVARYGPLSDGDARIRVARDEYNRQAAQEEEAQRVRNKEVRDEAGYIRRWLRKVRFNVRISITEAKIRDIRGLWAKGDKRAHLNCNEWMCASYRILRELHNRGVGQSKAIMWPEYYDREIVKEAAELVVMEANKRAICRQTLS
ncbi:uncharacterized protein HRG_10133 [Hirsutella rhossiliensis]|uniref:HTH CENPB-type domain-containing protein n=1 Tax=Hirsutella rhossiliensis TaxID=111463 RepID=A0A9P8SEW8_9HYPO|nr:uncharacterized protein HRG_10133 [Hirsutella rhossiliensis]KAH0958446.1 hypothetical protein HRG_10133 [Hirsutella rhossiliensis]